MTDEAFMELVGKGLDDLREDIRARIKNVAVVVEDEPTLEQLLDHGLAHGDILFGLYEGVPLTERGIEAPLFPDKITIFKKPILATYSLSEDIEACVKNTVWHEVAHHFGLDEEAVAYEELKRGKVK